MNSIDKLWFYQLWHKPKRATAQAIAFLKSLARAFPRLDSDPDTPNRKPRPGWWRKKNKNFAQADGQADQPLEKNKNLAATSDTSGTLVLRDSDPARPPSHESYDTSGT